MQKVVHNEPAGLGAAICAGALAGSVEAAWQWRLGGAPLLAWNGWSMVAAGLFWGAIVALPAWGLWRLMRLRAPASVAAVPALVWAIGAMSATADLGGQILGAGATPVWLGAGLGVLFGVLALLAHLLTAARGVRWGMALAGWLPVALATLLSSAESQPPPGPPIVLVTVDGLGADDLPAEGNLAALARSGVQYERAITPVARPRLANLVVLGLTADRCTVPGPAPVPASPLVLGPSAGFISSAAVAPAAPGSFRFRYLDADFSLVQGLRSTTPGRWLRGLGLHHPPQRRDGSVTIDAALAWLGSNPGGWFVWVHLDDPLAPHRASDPWDKRFVPEGVTADPNDERWRHAQYLGEVAQVDHHLGRLIDGLPADATIAVVGTGGGWDEGDTPAASLVAAARVPLILRRPDGPTGAVPWPVSTAGLSGSLAQLRDVPLGRPLPRPSDVPTDLTVFSVLDEGAERRILAVGPTSMAYTDPGQAAAPLTEGGQVGDPTGSTLEKLLDEVARELPSPLCLPAL